MPSLSQEGAELVDTLRDLDADVDDDYRSSIEHGHSVAECAAFFGVGQSTIDNTQTAALKKIRANPEALDALREYLSNNCGTYTASWE